MAWAALGISMISLVLAGGALIYTRRADTRAVAAEGRAADAEGRAERDEERQRAAARLRALERVYRTVHDLSHSITDAMMADVGALARARRQRARLRELLEVAPVPLPKCGEALEAAAYGPEFEEALAEVEREIAREQDRLAAL